jgi:hypothetical protein
MEPVGIYQRYRRKQDHYHHLAIAYKDYIRCVAPTYAKHFSQILIRDLCSPTTKTNTSSRKNKNHNNYYDCYLSMVRLNMWQNYSSDTCYDDQSFYESELLSYILLVHQINLSSSYESSTSGIFLPWRYTYDIVFPTSDRDKLNSNKVDRTNRHTVLAIHQSGMKKKD